MTALQPDVGMGNLEEVLRQHHRLAQHRAQSRTKPLAALDNLLVFFQYFVNRTVVHAGFVA